MQTNMNDILPGENNGIKLISPANFIANLMKHVTIGYLWKPYIYIQEL